MSELKVKVLEAPIFEGVAQDLVLKSNNVNRIVIANTGPVSIQSNLSYSGTLTGNTGIINIGSGQIYKDASGNVGIGTSTPIYKLHVTNSAAANSNTDIIGMTSNYFTNAKKSLTWFSGTDAVGKISTVYNTISGEVGIDMTFGSLYNLGVGMNDSELMRLTSGGRLGIGTPLPDSLLTVNGVASFAAGSAGFPSIARAGDLDTGIFFPAADTIAFTEGGVESMRINSDGNVGIGSTSPVTAIEIIKTTPTITLSPSAYSGAYRTTLGTRSGAEAFLIFGNNNQNEIRAGRTAVGGYLDFYTNNTVGQESASDGVLVMRMTSSGNVGIGTSSPSEKLVVCGDMPSVLIDSSEPGGSTYLRFADSGVSRGHIEYRGNHTMRFRTDGLDRLLIDATGRLALGSVIPTVLMNIGGAAPVFRIHTTTAGINSRSAYLTWTQSTNTETGNVGFRSGGDDVFRISNNVTGGDIGLFTSNAERMRIDSSGNLLVGTTSSAPVSAQVNGIALKTAGIADIRNSVGWNFGTSGSSGIHLYFYTDNGSNFVTAGQINSNGSTTSYVTSSDYRLKENVQPLTNALSQVSQLRPVVWKWKNGVGGTNPNGQGFIAHELQEVVPDAVTGDKDAVDADGKPQYQGVDTSFLVATLVAAIQELTARLEVLENK